MTAGLETFAKVRALHDGTTNAGEKAAAMTRMQALARKAGMSVDEAVSRLDAPPATIAATSTVDIGSFFDTPYFRELMAKRKRERAVRWREVLDEYGSEAAVFAPGPMEQALDEAAARFGPDPGWDAFPLSAVPSAIVATVEAAWPMPGTVREAWDEFAFWDKLGSDREARGSACGDHSPAVQLRSRILECVLDEAPALSLNDLRARVSWLEFLDNRDAREHGARLATLRADIERMGARLRDQDGSDLSHVAAVQTGRAEGGPQSGHPQGSAQCAHPSPSEPVQTGHVHRSNADKRCDVLALLTAEPALTDREIARRTGVSPTTVGTIRRTM